MHSALQKKPAVIYNYHTKKRQQPKALDVLLNKWHVRSIIETIKQRLSIVRKTFNEQQKRGLGKLEIIDFGVQTTVHYQDEEEKGIIITY